MYYWIHLCNLLVRLDISVTVLIQGISMGSLWYWLQSNWNWKDISSFKISISNHFEKLDFSLRNCKINETCWYVGSKWKKMPHRVMWWVVYASSGNKTTGDILADSQAFQVIEPIRMSPRLLIGWEEDILTGSHPGKARELQCYKKIRNWFRECF